VKRALIIPFYNFEMGATQSLERVSRWVKMQGEATAIYLVDDGSTDGTAQILRTFEREKGFVLVKGFEGSGKGAAVRAGFLRAADDGCEQIVFTDCDLHYGLEIISEKIFPALELSDVVIVDRAWAARGQHPSWIRQISSGIFNRLVAILTGVAFKDTQAGLKGFRASPCLAIFRLLTIEGFTFDVEILSIALFYRFRVHQIPIIFSAGYEQPGASTVNLLKSSLDMFFDLLRVNINWKRGNYDDPILEKRVDQETYRIAP